MMKTLAIIQNEVLIAMIVSVKILAADPVLISEDGVSGQSCRAVYPITQPGYNPTTNTAYLPYMIDPGSGEWQNYCVAFDMKNRTMLNKAVYVGSAHREDNHNAAWLAVDAAGYVHTAYGCHNSTIYYRRSKSANDADLSDGFGAESKIGSGTYPYLVCHRADAKKIGCIYRGGKVGREGTTMRRSADGGKTWDSGLLVVDFSASGSGVMVYHCAQMAPDCTIHLIWSWRPTPSATSGYGVYYALSRNFGDTWEKADGTKFSLPIKEHNGAQIVSGQYNRITQNVSIGLDNNPVIFYADRKNDILNMIRWDGNRWVTKKDVYKTLSEVQRAHHRVKANGNIIVFGTEKRDGKDCIVYGVSHDDGNSWSELTAVSTDATTNNWYPLFAYEPAIPWDDAVIWATSRCHVMFAELDMGGSTVLRHNAAPGGNVPRYSINAASRIYSLSGKLLYAGIAAKQESRGIKPAGAGIYLATHERGNLSARNSLAPVSGCLPLP
jgi:hypothetical protein